MRRLLVLASLLTAGCHGPAPVTPPGSHPLAIRGVRLFDGETSRERMTVIVAGDRISAVGAGLALPAGAEVVDGSGKTLLPGLIDAHAHVWDESSLETAAVFGVTTVLDMGCGDPRVGRELKEEAEKPGASLADLRFAGYAVTVPGGHCTEYGLPVPTVTKAEEVDAFVDQRVGEGSDYLKIILEDGKAIGLTIPTIDEATLRAAVAAAHRHGKLAVVHIATVAAAREAISAGADGLAHVWADEEPDPSLVRSLLEHHAFVTATLSVIRSSTATAGGEDLASDAGLLPWLDGKDLHDLRLTFPVHAGSKIRYERAEAAVTALAKAGVPVLAGTDAPNPGTVYGVSLLGEVERLAKAGLSPLQALRAATSAPADAFHLPDRGRIATGLRADLLLVEGDPLADPRSLRRIDRVWVHGVPVDREGYRKRVEESKRPVTAGMVSDFEDGKVSARIGSWSESTDAIRGGKSTATLAPAPGGARGSGGSLLVTGEVARGLFAWAGAMYFPAMRPLEPANLSATDGFSFRAKGDGKTYRVMVFSESRGFMPSTRTFTAGAEWSEAHFRWKDFDGLDGHDLTGIAFVGGPEAGPIRFQLDDLELTSSKP